MPFTSHWASMRIPWTWLCSKELCFFIFLLRRFDGLVLRPVFGDIQTLCYLPCRQHLSDQTVGMPNQMRLASQTWDQHVLVDCCFATIALHGHDYQPTPIFMNKRCRCVLTECSLISNSVAISALQRPIDNIGRICFCRLDSLIGLVVLVIAVF